MRHLLQGVSGFRYRPVLAEAYRLTMYHGTALPRLKSILAKGLVPEAGINWGGGNVDTEHTSVYLTPKITTAVRYAWGAGFSDVPIVLELLIASPKKINKLKYDELDRYEDIWELGHDTFSEIFEEAKKFNRNVAQETIRILQTTPEIRAAKGDIFWGLKRDASSLSIPTQVDDLAKFRGFSLYRAFLQVALSASKSAYWGDKDAAKKGEQLYRANKQQWLAKFRREFPSGYTQGPIEVSQSGTILLSNEYFEAKLQYTYPKSVPPKAIKAVWVLRTSIPPAYRREVSRKQSKRIGAALLPQEVRFGIDKLVSLVRWVNSTVDADEFTQYHLDDPQVWADEDGDAYNWLRSVKNLVSFPNGPILADLLRFESLEMGLFGSGKLVEAAERMYKLGQKLLAYKKHPPHKVAVEMASAMQDLVEEAGSLDDLEDRINQHYWGSEQVVGEEAFVRLAWPADKKYVLAAAKAAK